MASINSPIWINIGKIYLLSSPLNHFKNFSEIEFTKYFKGGLLCAKVKIVDKIPNKFMENFYYKIQNETFNFSNTNFLIEINKVSWTRKLISSLEFHLHSYCPLKQVADYILLKNKTLEIENSDKVPFNDSFRICIPAPDGRHYSVPPYKWLENLSKALRHISVFGIIVSIIFYFIIIIIYQFMKETKSLTSTLIALQCTTLLVKDATFIIALQIRRYNLRVNYLEFFCIAN